MSSDRVYVALDNRFLLYDDVLYDTYTQDLDFWSDYLEVFDEVVIIGRAKEVNELPDEAHRASGQHVDFVTLPYWEGIVGWMRNRHSVRQELQQIAKDVNKAILRVPGMVGTYLGDALREESTPYAVEVTQDVNGTYPKLGPLETIVELYLSRLLGRTVSSASAASYVTKSILQERYPARNAQIESYYSSIRLQKDQIRDEPRSWNTIPESVRIAHVGSMFDGRKGQDVLIETLKELQHRNMSTTVCFVGGGPMLEDFKQKAKTAGVMDRCDFTGNVERERVFQVLDQSDLFVFPSKSEGLPRVLIEAMARGLPVLSSPAGGIPEILPPDALIPRKPKSIADQIEDLLDSPETLEKHSQRNLQRSREFEANLLRSRRINFYTEYDELAKQN
jgi:hypothetical protein